MNKDIRKQFFTDTDETGRHKVVSIRTGKEYFIEVIGDGRMADWGSYNPSTGNIENKKGSGKHAGSVTPEESLIVKENGFSKIHETKIGESPYSIITEIDKQYPDKK